MNLFPSMYTGKPEGLVKMPRQMVAGIPQPVLLPLCLCRLKAEQEADSFPLACRRLLHRAKWPAQHSQVLQLARPSPVSPQTPSLGKMGTQCSFPAPVWLEHMSCSCCLCRGDCLPSSAQRPLSFGQGSGLFKPCKSEGNISVMAKQGFLQCSCCVKCSSALCQLEGQQQEPGAGNSLACLSASPQREEKLGERHPSKTLGMGNGTTAAGPQGSRGRDSGFQSHFWWPGLTKTLAECW